MRRQLRRTPYRLARNQQKHPGGPPRFLNPGYVLGEQTSHKQRVVPYVFAHLTLSVERCCFEQGVGFDEHLPHVVKGLALDISNSMEALGSDEVCEPGSHIGCHLRLPQSHVFEKVTPNQFAKEVAERARATST